MMSKVRLILPPIFLSILLGSIFLFAPLHGAAQEKRDLTESSWSETGYSTKNAFQDDPQLRSAGVATRRVLKVTEGVPDKPARGILQVIQVDNDALIRELKVDGTWDGVTLVLSYLVTQADWGYDGKETLRLKLVVKDKEPTRLVGKAEAMVNTATGPLASPDRDITFDEDGDRLPVIFLPGVAGTALFNNLVEVWPAAPAGTRLGMRLGADGAAPEPGSSITVGDILRNFPANFYGSFLESLEKRGYKLGTDLFVFPYDWRKSNDSHFAALDKAISDALEKSKKKKAVLIAHSMGGVIARGYIYSGSARSANVDSVITIGTPFWGAPKVYYGMISGYTFGNDFVDQTMMKALVQNFPAAYQLLPQKPFITDKKTDQKISLDLANSIRYKGFSRIPTGRVDTGFQETSENNSGLNADLLLKAKQFFSSVGTPEAPKSLPPGVSLYTLMGTGVATVGGYEIEDWVPAVIPVWPFNSSFLELGARKIVLHPIITEGDGTVPLWSLETGASTEKYYIPYEANLLSRDVSSAHSALPANPVVQSIVADILKHKPPKTNQGRPGEYMDLPTGNLKSLEASAEFELHSDAHLRVSNSTGKGLGFNSSGGIEEKLPGTFLSYEGVEYAAVASVNEPLEVAVDGIRTGKFTLDVKVRRGGKPGPEFMYKEVPVTERTRTKFSFTPAGVTTPPALTVTNGASTTTVAAILISAGEAPGGGQATGDGSFLGEIPSVGGTVTSLRFFTADGDVPPANLRDYVTRFPKASLKTVYYELSIKYAANNATTFGIASTWSLNQRSFARQDLPIVKPVDWTTSTKVYGYGNREPGKWEAGTYTVLIEVEGRKVASASFVVF